MTADIKAEILAPTKNVVLTKVLSPTGGEILDDAIYNEEKIEVSNSSGYWLWPKIIYFLVRKKKRKCKIKSDSAKGS